MNKNCPEISHEGALLLLGHWWRHSDRAPFKQEGARFWSCPLCDFLNAPLPVGHNTSVVLSDVALAKARLAGGRPFPGRSLDGGDGDGGDSVIPERPRKRPYGSILIVAPTVIDMIMGATH